MAHDERLSRRGEFNHQVLTGIFDPVLEDGAHRTTYFGLQLEGSWPYGALRTESGKLYVLMRKVVGRTTTYLLIQTSGEGGLRIDPRSFERCAHGGRVLRRLLDDCDEYTGIEAPGRPRFKLKLGRDEFSWVESDVLSIEGKRIAPGWHLYVPWREGGGSGPQGGVYYTSICYTADGEILGEKASGFFILDQSYLPHGVDWNDPDNLVWSHLQRAWVVFANGYDDGTFEWGHFSWGTERFTFGVVSGNKNERIVESLDVDLTTEWSGDGYASRLLYDFGGGERWEFIADPEGRFIDFSAWNKMIWRGQAGLVQREGETRSPVRSMAWQEIFPDRLRP
jgi:hypothetical protein